jgi:GNAT superfamily N-acetyltransferase
MTGYEIILYRPDLEPGVVELRNLASIGGPAKSRQFLDWKYRQNPLAGESFLYVALHEGRVVGMRGAYGTCWQADGVDRIVLPAVDDFAVRPEHRNSGVATLIMRAQHDDLRARGYPFMLALSSGRMTTLASLASGWKSAVAMEPVVRFGFRRRIAHELSERLRGTRVLWRLARRNRRVVQSPTGPFERLASLGRTPGRETGTTIVFERVARADAMAALIQRLGYDGRIRHVRDAEFLAWRYQNPWREYGFLYLERADRLEGFLALGRFHEYRPPMNPFHVVDWEGVSPGARAELLGVALRHGHFTEIGAWSAAVHSEDRKVLAGTGFVPSELESRARGLPCTLVRAIDSAPASEWKIGNRRLVDDDNWDLRLLYSMHG